jgi:hypothetical protein
MELGFLTPLYNLLKDSIVWLARKKGENDPLVILELRRKWKLEFERNLRVLNHALTYGDAIIRDVSRMDSYPDVEPKRKGISPWFKIEIKGLYHRGVEVFLRIESLKYVESAQGLRFARYGEEGAINAYVVGKIPFEVIKSVEWNGDEYYSCPHIYCAFSKRKKQPYEDIVFYRREHGVESDYFIEIAKYDDVLKLSKKYPRLDKI